MHLNRERRWHRPLANADGTGRSRTPMAQAARERRWHRPLANADAQAAGERRVANRQGRLLNVNIILNRVDIT